MYNIFRYILTLLFFMNSDLLMAGEIENCDRSSKTLSMKCTIILDQGFDTIEYADAKQVIVRDVNGYWVASGKIEKFEDNKVIAIFDSTDSIKIGYKASVQAADEEAVISYDTTFEYSGFD